MHLQFKICEQCGKEFSILTSRVNQGEGKYCSRKCYHISRILPLEDRFWSFVEKTETCWLWTGTKNDKGYGNIKTEGKLLLSHRLSYKWFHGSIPQGLFICHSCDTPACVRPDHLFAGTQRENLVDMVRKGRQIKMTRGTDRYNAKVNEEKVKEIRQRYALGGVTFQQLADEYGIGMTTVYYIVRREAWKHVA